MADLKVGLMGWGKEEVNVEGKV